MNVFGAGTLLLVSMAVVHACQRLISTTVRKWVSDRNFQYFQV